MFEIYKCMLENLSNWNETSSFEELARVFCVYVFIATVQQFYWQITCCSFYNLYIGVSGLKVVDQMPADVCDHLGAWLWDDFDIFDVVK